MKLLLFDIDGTLVNTHGAGLRAMNRAFEFLYGHTSILDGIVLAGRTDVLILMDAFRKSGSEFSFADVDRFKRIYFEMLIEELETGQNHLLPGVDELLSELHATENVSLALLTGNWQHSGRLKIHPFGLNDYFPFGAFADDAVERTDLVPVAVERFERLNNHSVHPRDVLVIGDTPSDILCAKPHGAISVAVATGMYSCEELALYEPDFLLPDLHSGRDAIVGQLFS